MEIYVHMEGRGLQEDMGIEPGSTHGKYTQEPIPFARSQRSDSKDI